LEKVLDRFPKRFIEDPEYAFALGRIRCLEVHILEHSDYDKMAKGDINDVLKVLTESDFSIDVNLLLKEETFEKVIDIHKRNIFKLMDELIYDERVRSFLRVENDFYNAKILLLEKIFETHIQELSGFGNIKPEVMKSIFAEEKYNLLPKEIMDAVQEGIRIYYEKKEKRYIDFVFDKSYLNYVSSSSYPPFLQDYFRMFSDIHNLITLIRIKYFEEDKNIIDYVFSDNGFIPFELLKNLYFVKLEEIPKEMIRWIYWKPLDEGTKYLKEKKSFVKLENLLNKLLFDYLETTKYQSLGPEPVIAFILKKLNEIKNVRLTILGKFYNVKGEEILERII